MAPPGSTIVLVAKKWSRNKAWECLGDRPTPPCRRRTAMIWSKSAGSRACGRPVVHRAHLREPGVRTGRPRAAWAVASRRRFADQDEVPVREHSRSPFPGWDPPEYRVDTDGKVVGARARRRTTTGAASATLDQIGTANLLTPERVAAAAALVKTGQAVLARAPDRAADAGRLPRRAAALLQLRGRRRRARQRPRRRRVPGVRRLRRDGAAGVDPARRLRPRRRRPHALQRLLGRAGHRDGRRAPARHAPPRAHGIVGRAVLLDVARHLGVEHLEPGFPVGPDELDGAASRAGRRRSARATSCSCTPVTSVGSSASRRTPRRREPRSEPGISTRAIPWLHDHDVAMIATDTAACSVVPPEPGDDVPHVARRRAARPRPARRRAVRPRRARRRLRGRRRVRRACSSPRRCRSSARAAHPSTRSR